MHRFSEIVGWRLTGFRYDTPHSTQNGSRSNLRKKKGSGSVPKDKFLDPDPSKYRIPTDKIEESRKKVNFLVARPLKP